MRCLRLTGSILLTLTVSCLVLFSSLVGTVMAKAEPERITVFAAASLKSALDAIATKYQAGGAGPVVLSYAATSALAQQIVAGAPADVFVSADQAWMDTLADQNLIDTGSRIDLLGNRLVIVTPTGNAAPQPIDPGAIASTLASARVAVADIKAVPAGRYAKQALDSLGLWPEIQRQLVPAQNVRVALAYVARGEVPFGIVYRSDAIAEPKVISIVEIPEDHHAKIVYPAAVVRATAFPKNAATFLDYLKSDVARTIFEANGFTVLPALLPSTR